MSRLEMIDFTKIYCNEHPHELITNFCNKEQCLVGLCANCICTHTQGHVRKGTSPDYENIRNTYKKAQEAIRHQVQVFEGDKDRLASIATRIHEKRQKVKEVIEDAKDQVSLLLGNYFEDKEKNMLKEIEIQEKKYGLHCENRLESLNSYISREVSNMITAAQELSSNNFLESLPRVRTQTLVNSNKLHCEIEGELQQNERFNTAVNCNQTLLPGLIEVLERSITLQFSGMSQNQNMGRQQLSQPLPQAFPQPQVSQQPQQVRRPQSQGKTLERSFSTQNTQNSFNPHPGDRNLHSQVHAYHPQQQPQLQQPAHSSRPMVPAFKGSYLSEIPAAKMDGRQPFESNSPKLSVSQMNLARRVRNESSGYVVNPAYMQQVPSQQMPLNTELQNVNLVRASEKPHFNESYAPQQYSRSVEKAFNPSIVPSQQFTPNFNNISTSKTLEKSNVSGMGLGLGRKTKKSGLKVFTTQPEIEYPVEGENQKPKANKSQFY